MSKQIHVSDIILIIKLFFSKEYKVDLIDPYNIIEYNEDFNIDKNYQFKVLVNLSSDHVDFDQMLSAQYDYILNFSNRNSLIEGYNKLEFNFINNPDQTIRWIFPKKLRKPTFLNFYNSSTFKGGLFKYYMRLFHNTFMTKNVLSGDFTIYAKTDFRFERHLKDLNYQNYSIFTGTVGPNRKAIIELNSKGKTTHFVKVALNNNSKDLITNELKTLKLLSGQNFKYMETPKVTETSDDDIGVISNIKPSGVYTTSNITDLHLHALKEFYSKTKSKEIKRWSDFQDDILHQLSDLEKNGKLNYTKSIVKDIKDIANDILSTREIPCSMSHSDFTPWNMYLDKSKLFVYDWELSNDVKPMLFDLFHYVFQSGVLVKRNSFLEIKRDVDAALSNPIVRQIIREYKIDVALHYKLYLLFNITYYLSIYEKQNKLHDQVHWLMDVWQKALDEIDLLNGKNSFRTLFINELMSNISTTPYALLKFHQEYITDIKESSDLDILIQKSNLSTIISFVKNHPRVMKTKVYKKSFMSTVELFFKDQSFLSLDLIHKFQRKSINMFSEKEVLKNRVLKGEGISVPRVRHDFEYVMLFYFLNNSKIPTKYINYFSSLNIEIKNTLKSYISNKYNLKEGLLEELMEYSKHKREHVLKEIQSHKRNKGLSSIWNKFCYLVDTSLDLLKRKGFVVTFSGVDGAGKSTIISMVTEKLALKFRKKVIVIRHRPSLLPILSAYKYGKKEAELRTIQKNPREGSNKSLIGSLLRFTYYLVDYLVGQFYIYFKYTVRGYIVVYDRYYFDFINDSKRSNILLPKWLTKGFYRMVFKPKINVFLYANPEIILNRKKELDKETIEKLTEDYQNLFDNYENRYTSSTYLQIENIDLQKTIDKVMNKIAEAA